ncbi:nucleotidyl transferase AbiEii/AbiGii toxin family protein [Brucella pituitosa]|uniref:nucleotidyl transferase AbiEii/AbiGii toxin family protein n=1 Tax=Brucella pituitosa TaxID=571256 RepID=UPI00142D2EBA|nr:nucleotidyl transferase AbiEii/AbiGii toxin family protein [Brucella pituitosa]
MLVTVWVADGNRVTRDADFLGHGDADPDRLIADFGEIMAMESEDGLAFDIDALAATVIREAMEYEGVRLKTAAYLESTRIPITIDIGFGDAMADATQRLDYPTLLDFPAPQVRSYPPATVMAEKFQAMVALCVLPRDNLLGFRGAYVQLPEVPRNRFKQICDLARQIMEASRRNPERSVALRRPLEAKDAAIRACV